MSVFETLNKINVNDKTEKKNGLTYLSWAWAWGEAKKQYPEASYTIYENNEGWNYFTDGKTCWVKTGVTIEGLEHIEYLPVMDYRNKSITADSVTSFDVNKAIQRSLTKALARHGLGLYIYAGEDLPDGEEEPKIDKKNMDLIVELAAKYAEIKNGNADELLKYYLNKCNVKSIEELTYTQGIMIGKELSNLIQRNGEKQ
jgi:hypothetical protein